MDALLVASGLLRRWPLERFYPARRRLEGRQRASVRVGRDRPSATFRDGMKRGRFSLKVDYGELSWPGIDDDVHGPAIKAVIELNPDAVSTKLRPSIVKRKEKGTARPPWDSGC